MGAVMQSNAIFLTISNGQICKKVKGPTSISKERVNKNGATVHEEYYKGWKGQITAIEVREHKEYGKFWYVTLTDDQGDAILQMKYSSGYANAFLRTLPNIDLNSDVKDNVTVQVVNMNGQIIKRQNFNQASYRLVLNMPNVTPGVYAVQVSDGSGWKEVKKIAL